MDDRELGLACPHALQLGAARGLDVLEQEHGRDVLEQGAPGQLLAARDFLAALLLSRWRLTERVLPRGRAPWGQGAFLRGRRLRRPRSFIARAWRGAVQREGWRRGAPSDADEFGDSVVPLFVDVVDWAVAQELVFRDERSSSLHGRAARAGRRIS